MTNTTRSPPRHAQRDDTANGIGKSVTGKQSGDDTRHAIITTARTSTDQEGGGLIEARKQEIDGRRWQGERKEKS